MIYSRLTASEPILNILRRVLPDAITSVAFSDLKEMSTEPKASGNW